MNIIKFQNGAEFLSLKCPNTNQINLTFFFKGGPVYEGIKNAGITHLIEHLCFRRLGNMSQSDIYEKMNSVGCLFKGATGTDYLVFDITVSKKYFFQAFDCFKHILDSPQWKNIEEVNKEKRIVINQIYNKPVYRYTKKMTCRYFSGTKLYRDIMGTAESVTSLTVDEINSWAAKILIPANLCCVITGDFDDIVADYVKSYISSVINKNTTAINSYCKVPNDFTSRSGSSDMITPVYDDISDISIIFDVEKSINDASINLLSSILTQGCGSLLSMILREQKGYTDEIFPMVDMYNGFSRFVIDFASLNKNITECLKISAEILNASKEMLSEKDLASSIVFFTENQKFEHNDPRNLGFWLGYRYFILNKTVLSPKELSNEFEKLTVKNLCDTAQKVFTSSNLSIYVTNNSRIVKRSTLKEEIYNIRDMI